MSLGVADSLTLAPGGDVVELELLLTRQQVLLLERIGHARGQSVGQVIRAMILNGLAASGHGDRHPMRGPHLPTDWSR
jgi:hypothetical protein